MESGALDTILSQDALRRSIDDLNPSKGRWYQECVVDDISFLVYIGKGTKYPVASSLFVVLEMDCRDVEHNNDVLHECVTQLAVQPKVDWYTADMAAKHLEYIHIMLQPLFPIKEALAKHPNDTSLSVLLIINGYREI